jgi:hypothetical protein
MLHVACIHTNTISQKHTHTQINNVLKTHLEKGGTQSVIIRGLQLPHIPPSVIADAFSVVDKEAISLDMRFTVYYRAQQMKKLVREPTKQVVGKPPIYTPVY